MLQTWTDIQSQTKLTLSGVHSYISEHDESFTKSETSKEELLFFYLVHAAMTKIRIFFWINLILWNESITFRLHE